MRLFPPLKAEIAVAFAPREYQASLEIARCERGRGPVKKNSVNYDPD